MSEIIHIKLEYAEALQSKKDILASEINLLRIAKAIRTHKILRLEELKTKARLHRKLKSLKTNITKLQQVLPKLKVPILDKGKDDLEIEVHKRPEVKKAIHDSTLESQLKEIQDRLRQLG